MSTKHFGFSTVEILLGLLLMSIVGFGGYYVWHNQTTNSVQQADSTISRSETGGPAPEHIVTNTISLTTGQYLPAHVDIKKGDTVTWKISDISESKYAIESDANSTEVFSSPDLATNDTFTHTFDTVGVFNWHDKYNGNLIGSVTVKE